jgi:hypothetical protein
MPQRGFAGVRTRTATASATRAALGIRSGRMHPVTPGAVLPARELQAKLSGLSR